MKPWSEWTTIVFAPVFVALLAGCDDGRPTRVPVAGKVMIDGKPLESGNIRVHAAANRAASGKIGQDGRFTLSTYEFGDGCVPGMHTVTVTGSKVLNPQTMRWYAPKRYANASTSGLTVDITEATDAADINLTWDGGEPFDERILGGGI